MTLRGRGCRVLYAATVEAATTKSSRAPSACSARGGGARRGARGAPGWGAARTEMQHDEMESFASARLKLIVGASPRTAAAPRTRSVYYECGGEADGGGLELW